VIGLVAAGLGVLGAEPVAAASGDLAQKAGTAGCLSDSGNAGTCADVGPLDAPSALTISPDGANVYVAAYNDDAIVVFDRDATTGALTQKAGTAGCISDDGTAGACTDGNALHGVTALTISPDGANLYAASDSASAVVVFDRNTTTGVLTQKAGTAGCISDDGTAGTCSDGNALHAPSAVLASADGDSVYVASLLSDAVNVFDRDPTTGALTQKAGTAGCISQTGTAGTCADGNALVGASEVTVSPDGEQVYVVAGSNSAVVAFDRDTATGALTQLAGTAGCTSEDGTGGTCTDGHALTLVTSIAVAPDGDQAYVTSLLDDAVSVFDRDAASGALTQRAGTAGCISDEGLSGTCADGNGLRGATAIAISATGANVYASSVISDAVAVFDREPDDAVYPGVTITTPPDDATYVRDQVVTADYVCTDDTAVATCVGDVADGAAVDTSTLGAQTFTVTATDTAGNDTTVVNDYTVVVPACQGQTVTVDIAQGDVPTNGDDVILGTPGADTIVALGGDDLICGRGGADAIRGGAGRDRVFGAGGDDTLTAGPDGGLLAGNAGDDTLIGGRGKDTLRGGANDDAITGGAGNDLADGGLDTDTCALAPGHDTKVACEG
jgi:6-phosphogluconolactonase (cycloisomerase 2 family)